MDEEPLRAILNKYQIKYMDSLNEHRKRPWPATSAVTANYTDWKKINKKKVVPAPDDEMCLDDEEDGEIIEPRPDTIFKIPKQVFDTLKEGVNDAKSPKSVDEKPPPCINAPVVACPLSFDEDDEQPKAKKIRRPPGHVAIINELNNLIKIRDRLGVKLGKFKDGTPCNKITCVLYEFFKDAVNRFQNLEICEGIKFQ